MAMAKNEKDLDPVLCSGIFTKLMGLLCKHQIKRRLDANQVLRLEDFDSSQYLRSFGDAYRRPILPPLKAAETTRYRRTNGSRSSTRLESGFERAARETAQKIAYEQGKKCFKCSICPPEERWGHRKNQPICPKHPKHQEWLALQAPNEQQRRGDETTETASQISVNDGSAWYQQHHPAEGSRALAQLPINDFEARQSERITGPEIDLAISDDELERSITSQVDSDYDLEQYHGRTVVQPSGFKTYIPPRDPNELPEPKRTEVIKLLRKQMDNLKDDDEEDEGEEARTEQAIESLYTQKARAASMDISSVEGVYFLYKFKRNSWRAKQLEGSDLSDLSYRKALGLPKYTTKEIKDILDILKMSPQVDSRPPPFNIWTSEERRA